MKALICLFAFVWSVLAVLLLLVATQHICAQPFTLEDEVMLRPKAVASAPASWAPTNAYVWYHADGTNLADGAVLSWLADSSGNGKTAWAFGADPATYGPYFTNNVKNSKPSIYWHGGQCMTNAFGSTLAQPWTIFIVCYKPGGTENYFLDGATSSPRMVFHSDVSTAAPGIFGGSAFLTGGTSMLNTWLVMTLCYNGSSSYIRTNGVLTAGPGTDIGSSGSLGFAIGGRYDMSDFKLIGHIPEMIFYHGTMNTNDMQWVESNLKTKYGL